MFKKDDIVRCTSFAFDYISAGKNYTVAEDQTGSDVRVFDNDGDKAYYTASNFELVTSAPAATFKIGDKVRYVTKENYGRLSVGEVYVIEQTNVRGGKRYLKFADNDYFGYEAEKFAPENANKLKLPLAITRSTGTKVVLVAGSKPGYVTLVYVDGSNTLVDQFTEAAVLNYLDIGTWTVNGAADAATLRQDVDTAKADVKVAADALAAAQDDLAAAEHALANYKPYLA